LSLEWTRRKGYVRVIDDLSRTLGDYPYTPPSAPYSYLIFKKAGIVYARNGKTGELEFSDEDAATVIQKAIDALPAEGGKIFTKSGVYLIKNRIKMRTGVWLEGEGLSHAYATVLKQAANFDELILMEDILHAGLCNIGLRGDKDTYTRSVGLRVRTTAYAGDLEHCIENVLISNFPEQGVLIQGDSRECHFTDVRSHGNGEGGFHVYGGNHRFVNCVAGGNTYQGFTLMDGFSTYIGIAAWSNTTYGIYIAATTNGDIIIGQAYDNYWAGFCIEETIAGSPPHQNLVYIISMDSTRGFWIKGGEDNLIAGVATQVVSGKQATGVRVEGGANNIMDVESYLNGTADWELVGGTYILKSRRGLKNSGTATIVAGATSVTVAHGLIGTPRIAKHCPRANLGAVWVSARDTTNITLNVEVAPTVDTITDWEAEL